MNQFFNQYSFVFLSLGILLSIGLALRLLNIKWRTVGISLGVGLVALVIGWAVLRPNLSDVNTVEAAENLIANGKPTFVEFFSQYCLGCVAARPEVDALVTQIDDDFNILRVDIHTDFGRALREKYTFSFSPEFVLFDTQGQEVWRAHVPPAKTDLALVETQSSVGNS